MLNVFMFLFMWLCEQGLIGLYFILVTGSLPTFGYIEPIYIVLYILATSAMTALYILPALICKTSVKIIIFILCFFTSFTGLGWILLMVWAVSSNNSQRRREHEEELLDILRDRY